jgi:NAD(P)-dependent dehydrogenase (short-subunit alcohol dehydrogenase family)
MKQNDAKEWKSIVKWVEPLSVLRSARAKELGSADFSYNSTSSIAGIMAETGIPIAYTSTKFAVRGLTKQAAALGSPLQIRVNSIHRE